MGDFVNMLNFLDTPSFRVKQKNLDILSQRMNIIGQNIANVNTPHYKAKKLEFESLLLDRLDRLNSSHALRMRFSGSETRHKLLAYLDSARPTVFTDNATETRVDGNNVDIDHENIEMARVQIQYNFMIRKITDEYNLIRHAISEGR